MENLKKAQLKELCISKGLEKKWNGIPIYKMTKKHFLDFLKEKNTGENILNDGETLSNLLNENVALKIQNQQLTDKTGYLDDENLKQKFRITRLYSIIDSMIKNQKQNIMIKQTPPPIENENVETNLKCPVCLENKVNTVFKCTHVVCKICSEQLKTCPICRDEISKNQIMYFRI